MSGMHPDLAITMAPATPRTSAATVRSGRTTASAAILGSTRTSMGETPTALQLAGGALGIRRPRRDPRIVIELFGERQIGQHRSEAARQVHHAPASIARDRGEIRRLCRRGGRHDERKEGENGSHAQP